MREAKDATKRAGPPKQSLRSDAADEAKFEKWFQTNGHLLSKKAHNRTYQKFKSPETIKTALGAIGRWMIDESKRTSEPVSRGYKEAGVSPDGQLWKNYQRNRISLNPPDSKATILIQLARDAVRTKSKSSADELDQLGAFVELVTLAQHQTGNHFQDIQHRFPDTHHSVIVCLADYPKARFEMRAHEREGEVFETDMETGDIIVFNRYWHTGMRYSNST